MVKNIKIITVDDHPLALKGLKSLLEEIKGVELIGEALNGMQCLELLKTKQPDIVLLDLDMPEMGGEETMKHIKVNYPNIKVIIVSFHKEEEFTFHLISQGANAYVTKGAELEVIANTIFKVYEHGFCHDGDLSIAIAKWMKKKSEEVYLTQRETEILNLVCEGSSNKAIAVKLNISIKTVDFHKANIARKTQAFTPIALVNYARERGMMK